MPLGRLKCVGIQDFVDFVVLLGRLKIRELIHASKVTSECRFCKVYTKPVSIIYGPAVPAFITTASAKPTDTPTVFFPLRAAAEIEIEHEALGGALTLTGPADLWAWEFGSSLWIPLEIDYPAQDIVLADGEKTRVLIVSGSFDVGAVALAYTAAVDGGTAIHTARTKRNS